MPPPPARASDETLTLTMTPFPEAPTAPSIPEEHGDLVLAALLPRRALCFERVRKRPAYPFSLISRQTVVTNWVLGNSGLRSPMICTGPRRPGRSRRSVNPRSVRRGIRGPRIPAA